MTNEERLRWVERELDKVETKIADKKFLYGLYWEQQAAEAAAALQVGEQADSTPGGHRGPAGVGGVIPL